MMEELVRSGDLYAFVIDDETGSYGNAVGIVTAGSEDEARQKVSEAYVRHGFDPSELTNNLHVYPLFAGANWFFDAPDVLEVAEV